MHFIFCKIQRGMQGMHVVWNRLCDLVFYVLPICVRTAAFVHSSPFFDSLVFQETLAQKIARYLRKMLPNFKIKYIDEGFRKNTSACLCGMFIHKLLNSFEVKSKEDSSKGIMNPRQSNTNK